MTAFDQILAAFHLLRPWVLIALFPLAWVWWQQRKRQHRPAPDAGAIAPHLAKALTVGAGRRMRLQPIDVVGIVLALLILAASGPTWSRTAQPFAAQTAPMVAVLQVTPSMEADDISPTRLARAKHKITDLLSLRAGARTALVAYSGTAHLVVPMTEDPNVMQPYLEGLSTEVMPQRGLDISAAHKLAQSVLAREETTGGVVFLLDDLPQADAATIANQQKAETLGFLFMRPEGQPLPNVPPGALAERVTPDGRDITRIERAMAAAYRQALLEDSDQPWHDRGSIFAWPAALLMLLWFRRGMVVRWAALAGLALFLTPFPAQAEGWRDLFLTPDQQGWRAYQSKDYVRAADLFADPYARGMALYRAGKYEDAAEVMGRIDSADAAFVQGMAHIRARAYRDGVRAFEHALELDPTHKGAQANLPIARHIVDFVETTREQSDTGEDSGIGADDVVFDNEESRGTDTQIEAPQEETPALLSTEQWMNTVDTRTGDFLRQRFALEASRDSQ